MKSRKTTKRKIVAITPDNVNVYMYGLTNMIDKCDFSPYLVRKFNNTNISVSSKNKKTNKFKIQ